MIPIATIGYENVEQRLHLNGSISTAYGHDPVSRPTLLSHELAGCGHDMTCGLTGHTELTHGLTTDGLYNRHG